MFSALRCRLLAVTPNGIVALLVTLSLFVSPSASAQPPAGFGNLMVSGGSWLGGQGVDAYWNGTTTYVSNDYTAPAVGMKWQCVELPQRLYKVRGWYTGIFPNVGVAADIWNAAPNMGMEQHSNGSGYVPVPGDMIVLDSPAGSDSDVGHVSVVDYVDNAYVHVVEQNWFSGGTATYARSGNNGSWLARTITSRYTVHGIIHSPKNPNTNVGGGSDTDVYVNTSGNDSNNGSSGSPLRTVKHAVDQASSSQAATIHIAPGTYSEKVSTSKHIHFVTWGSGAVKIGG